MSQSLSRRSFLKYAGSGAVSLAAALLTGVSGAAETPCYEGEPRDYEYAEPAGPALPSPRAVDG